MISFLICDTGTRENIHEFFHDLWHGMRRNYHDRKKQIRTKEEAKQTEERKDNERERERERKLVRVGQCLSNAGLLAGAGGHSGPYMHTCRGMRARHWAE